MEKEIKEFIPFCKEKINNELENYEGQTVYACDLGWLLTEDINANGSFTYSRELAEDYLKEWWDDASDYWDYEKMNFGEHPHNPFEDAEGYLVCMVIDGVNGLLSKCPLIDDNWNDEIELTDDVVSTLKEQVEALSDDENVF